MSATAIEWATDVWNPTTGCDRVSPGCANCYALSYAARLKAMGQDAYQRDGGKTSGPGFGLTMHEDRLDYPLTLGRRRDGQRRRVFVNSMSDLFHEDVPTAFIYSVLSAAAHAPDHDFLILTKRAERMPVIVSAWLVIHGGPPPPNIWLGVSIENRRFVHRADLLRETPASVRFISAEPLLGPLVYRGGAFFARGADGQYHLDWGDGYVGDSLDLAGIDWLIVGGESGNDHRPIREQWVRDLRDACLAFDDEPPRRPAFFFKQWGGRTPKAGGRELDGRTWDELPTVRA